MSYDLNSKKIRSREKLIQYRKAFKEKMPMGEDQPQGEGELNRDGNHRPWIFFTLLIVDVFNNFPLLAYNSSFIGRRYSLSIHALRLG